MKLAENYMSKHILEIIEANKNDVEPELKEILEKYEAVKGQRVEEKALYNELVEKVEASANEPIKELLDMKGELVTKSQWIIGGDGWAYDIGYGGLDHVLANDQNVNVLVLDTEVYSNTGGQSSKSSQAASIAKFTASGKKVAKKDLAQIAMAYGHVYVAQIALGANPMQAIKAMKEALINGGTIGRRLDFIAQEMNREANTTLSKTSDQEISDKAIELKTDIEKVREQIQNIE